MCPLQNELAKNYKAFSLKWKAELPTVIGELENESATFHASYERLVSLNAWRHDLLENLVGGDAGRFFLEAQNDGLISHILASMGSWRSSFQALRSLIEDIYYFLYYKDHPVELQLWLAGKHRPGFQELHNYLLSHPDLDGITDEISGLVELKREYGTLSKAVHGSPVFHMTGGGDDTLLWSSSPKGIGIWADHHAKTIAAVNALLICFFRQHLQGTKVPMLRSVISLAVPAASFKDIKTSCSVVLKKP